MRASATPARSAAAAASSSPLRVSSSTTAPPRRQRLLRPSPPPPPRLCRCSAGSSSSGGGGGRGGGEEASGDDTPALRALFQAVQQGLQAAVAAAATAEAEEKERQRRATSGGASLRVRGLSYRPPGAPAALVDGASLDLEAGKLGVIFGRSGSGKTTLLQLVAGLLTPSSGSPARVGLVFQFPERHFLGETLVEELTFGWPPAEAPALRAARGAQAQAVLRALALDDLPLSAPLRDLSDGYKRRVALAVQLARSPDALLLDEPLAGLDWRARRETAAALAAAKARCCVLCVSHDLAELSPLVDGGAWSMAPGGKLRRAKWPPSKERKAAMGAVVGA